jgi:hypothetical protein
MIKHLIPMLKVTVEHALADGSRRNVAIGAIAHEIRELPAVRIGDRSEQARPKRIGRSGAATRLAVSGVLKPVQGCLSGASVVRECAGSASHIESPQAADGVTHASPIGGKSFKRLAKAVGEAAEGTNP